jgi:hypothetical protein
MTKLVVFILLQEAHLIMIKVIDIFGNDTTRIAEVTS